ncbi:hypothetical protein [Geoglobus ahangari]
MISLIAVASMCAQPSEKPPEKTPTPLPTPVTTPTPTPTPTATPAQEQGSASEVTSEAGPVCENCHLNSKRQYVPQADKIPGHIDGVKYCQYCHAQGNDVVNEIADLHHSKYSDCQRCHKDYDLEKMDCGSCHGYPDPFSPSGGNLLKIHMDRGVGCQDCHGYDFLRIHQDKVIFPDRFRVPVG